MCDFYIDVRGENDEVREGDSDIQLNVTNNCDGNEKLDLRSRLPEFHRPNNTSKKSENRLNVNDTYLVTNYKCNEVKESYNSNLSKIMSKSSLKSGLEKEHAIPLVTEKMAKLKRKEQRESTKGENWYNLPATEVTEEIKNDLQVLKMRSVLDKNHFYKKNDIKNISKYFQVGRVVENPADYYSGRIVKSMRKKTLVEELLADAECKNYQKKKYKEIMDLNRRRSRHKINAKTKNLKIEVCL